MRRGLIAASFVADAAMGSDASESRRRLVPKPSRLRAAEGRGYYEEVVTPFVSKDSARSFFIKGGSAARVMQVEASRRFPFPERPKTRERVMGARSKESARFRVGFLAALFLVYALLLSACSSSPVQEIVTTDASRSSALPPGAQPIAKEPKLPARDADIEAAGDRIAEAITYLSSKRREAALRALGQSEVALNRALRAHAGSESVSTRLRSTLKDLSSAQHAIQRGLPDAAKQLATINKNLDNLDLDKSEATNSANNVAQ